MQSCKKLLTPTSFIDYLRDSSLVKLSLWRRHALMVEDGAFSHKIDYITNFLEIKNIEEHPHRITGLRVLLNGWIFLSVELQRWKVCDQRSPV